MFAIKTNFFILQFIVHYTLYIVHCSQHYIRNHHIENQNDEAGDDDALRAGFAEFEGAAFDAVAVKRSHRGHDESENAGFCQGIDHVVNPETVGQTIDEVVGGDAVGDPHGEEAAKQGESDTEDTEHWDDDDRCQHFGQY